jgi:hypothetical protein
MATLKRRDEAGSSTGLQAALVASYEELVEQHSETIAATADMFTCPWPAQLSTLKAGEAIELPGWKILGACRAAGIAPPGRVDAQRRYRVGGDGTVSVLAWNT